MITPRMRHALNRVVVFYTGKGGVLKTSTSTHMAALAAAAGYKVLLIDLDPQNNTAHNLGTLAASDGGEALHRALWTGTPLAPALEARERLFVAPGGTALDAFIDDKPPEISPYDVLARCLAPVADQYQLIVVDTPPSWSQLSRAGLGAARWQIIPTNADTASESGIQRVAERMEEVRGWNPSLEILGVMIGLLSQSAAAMRRETRHEVEQILGGEVPLFGQQIRWAPKAAKASRDRGLLTFELVEQTSDRPIWSYLRAGEVIPDDARSMADEKLAARGVASDYVYLIQEILQQIDAREDEE